MQHKLVGVKTESAVDQQQIGGTCRLSLPRASDAYARLRNVQKNMIPYGLLSVDFKLSSKTGKLLQRLMASGSLELKVALLDQLCYFFKELMIEQVEQHHSAMFLQQLVTCVRHWRHSEIFKLRFREESEHMTENYQFVSIDSVKRRKRRVEEGNEQ